MDRLLAAVANRSQLAIVRQLLRSGTPLEPRELRAALGVATKDRAHFGRQVTLLYLLGVIERDGEIGDRYVVAEAELVERFLQLAGDLEAALDARRATRSKAGARAQRKETLTQTTKRIPPAGDG